MAKKLRYVKLGEKAAAFSDPYTHFTLAGPEVKPLDAGMAKTDKIKRALHGGHLEYADLEEYEAWLENLASTQPVVETADGVKPAKADKALKAENEKLQARIAELEEAAAVPASPFEDKTNKELVAYYDDTYEVTEEDLKEFGKKNKADKIAFLIEQAEED